MKEPEFESHLLNEPRFRRAVENGKEPLMRNRDDESSKASE
jgi:hypothetical protein